MSYQEDYREPYKSRCACGKGFLRYYKVYLSNDWFYEKEEYTKVELILLSRRLFSTKEFDFA